jgi:assimilatory nitrate reductase catalytic subunit
VDFADLLLPAASWAEKEGTVTNSERCISRVRAAVPPPGEARADWAIAAEVAQRLERLLPERRVSEHAGHSMFDWPDERAVWLEHREATRGRDLDITGLTWAALDTPRQWPAPEAEPAGRARLFADGRFLTPDGRARFTAPAWKPTAEARDAHYPVSLTTGRLRDQWHGMTRTGTLGRLLAHRSGPSVDLHPQELARRRLEPGDLVTVKSRRGTLVLPVQADDGVLPAQAFIAMHWGEEALGGANAPGVNALTLPAVCPQSKQPELKHTAVRIEPARLPWQLVAAAWLPAAEALALREALRARLRAGAGAHPWAYASVLPFGRDDDQRLGLRLQLAAAADPGAPAVAELAAALGLGEGRLLQYADARAGRSRRARIDDSGRLGGFLLAGDVAAACWMFEWLQAHPAGGRDSAALLSGGRQPPAASGPGRGAVICSCNDVAEADIAQALQGCAQADAATRLSAVQRATRCGTTCGSCLPALNRLVQAAAPLQRATS